MQKDFSRLSHQPAPNDFTATIGSPTNRRDFLKQMAGILVLVSIPGGTRAQEGVDAESNALRELPTDFNAFVHIGADNRITCFTGKIEMGQGPITSLVQMLADELDAPYENVDILMGDTDLCPWDAGTWGSMTTRFFGPALRKAAAEARQILIELAAEKWSVSPGNLVARDGKVMDPSRQDRAITYGALTDGKRIEKHLSVKPDLKDVAQFRIMGKPMPRRDAREKVTGQAKYTADIRLPGMLYARLLRPPVHGAKLKSVDTSGARKMEGIQVVEEEDLIAVLHPIPDRAAEALEDIKADWDVPESDVDADSIFEHLAKFSPEPHMVNRNGDLEIGKSASARTLETTYYDGYVAHAPMETHAALASFENDKMTVWASTQNPFGVRDQVAGALELPIRKVRVITPFVGGAFGGKTSNQQAVEAARLAKITGKPVQVMRTREEEFFFDTYRPAAMITIASGLDDQGNLTFWDYDVAYAGERGADHFYTIPHHRTVARPRAWYGPPGSHFFATGAWRAPGNNTNTFARESHIDALASLAGVDPVEFRLRHLKDPRMIRTLQLAAEKADWKSGVSPTRRGFGVACGIDAGSYDAMIAEVEVDERSGEVRVKRVVCAQDMGIVINPRGATLQVEGCVMMGMGYSLSEELRFRGGQIFDKDFSRYELPRFSWTPKIEAHFVDADDTPPQGGGEPAIIVVGAAIANAIYDATGARLNRLAMTPDRVRQAIRALDS